MWPLVVSAIVGALAVNRTKPKSQWKRRELIGPKSGLVYTAEDFIETGTLVLIAADGTRASFLKDTKSGKVEYRFLKGKGKPATVKQMTEDLGVKL